MSKLTGDKDSIALIDDEQNAAEDRLAKLRKKTQKLIDEKTRKNEVDRTKLEETFDNEGIWEHFDNNIPEQDVLLKALDSVSKDFEYEGKDDWNNEDKLEEMIKEDVVSEQEPELLEGTSQEHRRKDREFMKTVLGHLLRFYEPENIRKELYDKGISNKIRRNIFSSSDIYADFRYIYVNEKYEQIFANIPKNFRMKYTTEYLREAFMVLHVIYAHIDDSDIVDDRTIASIIVDHNDMLPATVMYQRPYDIEFFMNLSKYGVFNQVKRIVNDKLLINQIQRLMKLVTLQLNSFEALGDAVETKDIKDLSSVLESIKKTHRDLAADSEITQIAYIVNDTENGPDYSSLIDFETIDPETYINFDFKYFISAYSIDEDSDKTIHEGYVYYNTAKNKWDVSPEEMKIWIIPQGDDKKLQELERVYAQLVKENKYPEYKIRHRVIKEENVLHDNE